MPRRQFQVTQSVIDRAMITPLAYRVDDAAELVGISRDTIYKLITAGKLKTVKIGRCRVITAKVLNAMLEKGVSLP